MKFENPHALLQIKEEYRGYHPEGYTCVHVRIAECMRPFKQGEESRTLRRAALYRASKLTVPFKS